MKKNIKVTMLSAILFGSLSLSLAIPVIEAKNLDPDNIAVVIDGVAQQFDGQSAIMRDGSTLVPMRGIFEALGAKLEWDNETQTATATRGDRTVKLTVGSARALINGHEYWLSVMPQLFNNTTVVPTRFVAEALDAKVIWDSYKQQVLIKSYDNLEPFDKKVIDIVNEVTNHDMTDFQKIYALHKYIVNHVEYDRLNYAKQTVPTNDYTASGALLNGIAVCEGYASAYSTLLSAGGVKNHVVSGTAGGVAHAWNLVLLNDKWYFVDPTWDDNDHSQNRKFKMDPISFKGDIHVENTNPMGDLDFHYFLRSEDKMDGHKLGHYPSNTPKADTKYDDVFYRSTLISDKGDEFYLLRGIDWTPEEKAEYKSTRKSPPARADILKIDRNGDVSYPFRSLEAVTSYWKPQIQDGFIYYNANVDYKQGTGLNMYRVPENGGTPELVAKSAEEPILTSKYLFYVSNETVFLPGATSAELKSSLHRIDLITLADTTLAGGSIASKFVIDGDNVYYLNYVKLSDSKSQRVVSRVALTGGTPQDLATLDDISNIVEVKNGDLTYSTGYNKPEKTITLK